MMKFVKVISTIAHKFLGKGTMTFI